MENQDDGVLGYFHLELPYAGEAEIERDQTPAPLDKEGRETWIPFSLDSPYLTTGRYCDIPTEAIEADFLGCDNRYLSPWASKMLDDVAVLGLLRRELETIFHESTVNMVRFERPGFTDKWRSMYGAGVGMSSFFNGKHATLHRNHFRPRHPFSRMPLESVKFYFNKHFAIYFQRTEGTVWDHLFHTAATSRRVGCYVLRHWVRMHNGRPPFHRHHFLAKPIQFVHRRLYEGVYEHRVTDLPYVLAFHKSLCDGVAAQEDRPVPGHRWKRKKMEASGIPPEDRSPNFAPCLREGPLSYREHGYQLLPLFRALFMIVDGHNLDEDDEDELWRLPDYEIEPPPEWGRRDKWGRDPRQERDVDWCTSRHRVLLVRTGDDSHLSAPVSFGSLFASCRALPLGREDCRDMGEDVVRVRLDHALEFVEGLIRREKEALPRVRKAAKVLEDEIDKLCEQWVDRVLEHAEQVGLDANGFTWHASRRARARLNGEAFDVEQILPGRELVARWYMGGPG